jgi:CRP/FNR family transcriptional regulator
MTEHNHSKSPCSDCKNSTSCLTYGLDQCEFQQFTAIITAKRPLMPEQHLYRQGDVGDNLYIVKSGSFRSYLTSSDGMEQTLGFYLPGDLIGLDSLSNGANSCSVVALETAAVCELPKVELLKVSNKVNNLQNRLLQKIGSQISLDYARITLLAQRTAIEKTANFLYSVSKRYGSLGYSHTSLKLTMARRDIANFLGLTIETLCRQLATLNKMHIININQRQIHIENMEALKMMVEKTYS